MDANCEIKIVHVPLREDRSKIYHASLLQKKLPFGLFVKGSLTDEELRCANKEVESVLKEMGSGSDKRREKYNDYTPGRGEMISLNLQPPISILPHFSQNCQIKFPPIFPATVYGKFQMSHGGSQSWLKCA